MRGDRGAGRARGRLERSWSEIRVALLLLKSLFSSLLLTAPALSPIPLLAAATEVAPF